MFLSNSTFHVTEEALTVILQRIKKRGWTSAVFSKNLYTGGLTLLELKDFEEEYSFFKKEEDITLYISRSYVSAISKLGSCTLILSPTGALKLRKDS